MAVEISDSGEDIFKGLPSWMPVSESSGNFKLLDVVGRQIDSLEEDISDADDAVNVQTAQSNAQLKELARLVDLSPKSDEGIEKYRRRIIGEFQNTTNEGDLPGLFKNVAVLLDIENEDVGYIERPENGDFRLSVPGPSIESVAITKDDLTQIFSKQVAAGFSIDFQIRGTFTYITPEDYQSDLHDASMGYDGLDTNGDPKDNGGTYSGFLR